MASTNFYEGFEKSASKSRELIKKVTGAFRSRSSKIYPKGYAAARATDYELASKTKDQMDRIKSLLLKRPDIKKAIPKKKHVSGEEAAIKADMFNLWKEQMSVRSSAKTLKKKLRFKDQADGKY